MWRRRGGPLIIQSGWTVTSLVFFASPRWHHTYSSCLSLSSSRICLSPLSFLPPPNLEQKGTTRAREVVQKFNPSPSLRMICSHLPATTTPSIPSLPRRNARCCLPPPSFSLLGCLPKRGIRQEKKLSLKNFPGNKTLKKRAGCHGCSFRCSYLANPSSRP